MSRKFHSFDETSVCDTGVFLLIVVYINIYKIASSRELARGVGGGRQPPFLSCFKIHLTHMIVVCIMLSYSY